MQHIPTYSYGDDEAFIDSTFGIPEPSMLGEYYNPNMLVKNSCFDMASRLIRIENQLIALHNENENEELRHKKYQGLLDDLQDLKMLRELLIIFPLSKFSPYINLYITGLVSFNKKFNEAKDIKSILEVENSFLSELQKELIGQTFRKQVQQHKKSISKNKQSVLRYLESLFVYRSRLLVLRVDFSYRTEACFFMLEEGDLIDCFPMDTEGKNKLEQWGDLFRTHRKQLIDHLNKKYKDDFVGYVWKMEYGAAKGFHLHTILFLDGSKHRQDITIAEEIGEAWSSEITGNKGLYWNCNAQKKNYEKNNRVATGMIAHHDTAKIENLNRMACYLVKQDYFAKTLLRGKNRSFGKGGIPSKVKTGRPRK